MEFRNINEFGKGQNDSFESLVKVLARRENLDGAVEFQPNDGRGGDGGVEALWLLMNGSKVGYQSKFFSKLEDAQWKQMDESVKQALATHPQLVKYIFALPFDLTPDRGPKVRGESQQRKWDKRVIQWKADAEERSITLDFELWGATALTDKLMADGNGPLRAYWFGERVLDSHWFKRQVSAAANRLDDRFNPDDHVEVLVESLFDAIVRGNATRKTLNDAFDGLLANPVPNIEFATTNIVPDKHKLQAIQSDWEKLTLSKPQIDSTPEINWNWAELVDIAARLSMNISKFQKVFYETNMDAYDEAEARKVKIFTDTLRELASAIFSFRDTLSHEDLVAEMQRCAFVLGEAGSGKSHIFGQVASQRVEKELPTIFILGQDIGEGPFWSQLGRLLGVDGSTAKEILGILNAVGERLGTRVLILFDAINEGVGAEYWKRWLRNVVDEIQEYPFLAAVFSCRDVYAKFAIPDKLRSDFPNYFVRGYLTLAEKESAAIQYLDKKGISRPNTPWLSPEFSNPLFLKCTSEALAAEGKTEFPRGLHGMSRLMALYLESISGRMGLQSVVSNAVSSELKKLIREISVKMANLGQDFLTVDHANEIITRILRNRTAPAGKTWLEVFIQTNIFRRDPPLPSEYVDPLTPASELVRFSFQRFQDFLIADALVGITIEANRTVATTKDVSFIGRVRNMLGLNSVKIAEPKNGYEFLKPGPLSFLFYDNDLSKGVNPKFAGLITALSSIYPERVGVEFVLSLPNWEKQWSQHDLLHTAFAESFKWRTLDAFSEGTGTLLNSLETSWVEPLDLLLEVSMTGDHPYNAKRLHIFLNDLSLAERDSRWTQWINYSSGEEHSQIDRIVSWSLSTVDENTDVQHIELAAIVLAWSLSSSRMTLRDRATKALTVLFLKHGAVFKTVLQYMKTCNDPYIVERLYAAAFGACCNDPEPSRLQSYSQLVYDTVFASGEPPVALLTRDYALGVVELAEFYESTGTSVDLRNCYPPFATDPPEFGLTEERVEKIADVSGDKEIFYSAGSEYGDYGNYSIPGRVSSFLTTSLSEPRPRSKDEVRQACYDEVVVGRQDRIDALEAYEESTRLSRRDIFHIVRWGDDTEAARAERDKAAERKSILRENFERHLTDDERQRMSEEYFGDGKSHEQYEHVNTQQCQWWITERAYELGWTKVLFPRDGYSIGYSGLEKDLERIGKKYQRIALDELQARLADNFWLLQGWGTEPTRYRHSHHGYRRDLEPTILPNNSYLVQHQSNEDEWIITPKIELPEVTDADLQDWLAQRDPGFSAAGIVHRHSPDGRDWVVLYDHVHDKSAHEESGSRGHKPRLEEFRFFQCLLAPSGEAKGVANHLRCQQRIDFQSFKPHEYVDGPFIGEAFWRDTWESKKMTDDVCGTSDYCSIAIPVARYEWESHLDKTLPDGLSIYLPQRWFAEELGLVNKSEDFRSWKRESGEEVFKVYSGERYRQSGVVIEAGVFDNYLASHELEPVWFFIAERSAWPSGNDKKARRRRFEAAIWRDVNGLKSHNWIREF